MHHLQGFNPSGIVAALRPLPMKLATSILEYLLTHSTK